MPPRYAYWTILIDDKPTAFRARERDELQPTFVQLQRKNTNVTMQWFARGKLWATREAEREDFQLQKHAASAPRDRGAARPEGAERRGSDWRPGGAHKDPRDRFKKKNRPERAWSDKDPATQRDRDKPGYFAKRNDRVPGRGSSDRPQSGGWRDKPAGPPRGDRPWNKKPAGGAPSDRPWQTKPTGPRAQRKPWVGKPGPAGEGAGIKPRGDRPWNSKPPAAGQRPWSPKPPAAGQRPWSPKLPGGSRPPSGDRRPWSGKPRTERPGGFGASGPRGDQKPWQKKPFRPAAGPRKRRNDEPPDRD